MYSLGLTDFPLIAAILSKCPQMDGEVIHAGCEHLVHRLVAELRIQRDVSHQRLHPRSHVRQLPAQTLLHAQTANGRAATALEGVDKPEHYFF